MCPAFFGLAGSLAQVFLGRAIDAVTAERYADRLQSFEEWQAGR